MKKMLDAAVQGRWRVASLALAACLGLALSACGGGGAESTRPTELPTPPARLSLLLRGPAQVQPGEAVPLMGSLTLDSALPVRTTWQLLERPSDSQATLAGEGGSSRLLRTDTPGRYLVQWTAVLADGQTQSSQWAVEAVKGPLIQTSTGASTLPLGQSTALVAAAAPSDELGSTVYRWRLLQAPSGSKARLSGEFGQEVRLSADIPGSYQVELESRQGSTVSRTVRTLSGAAMPEFWIGVRYGCTSFVEGCGLPVGRPTMVSATVHGAPDTLEASYRWTLHKVPESSRLPGQTSRGPAFTFTPDAPGDYWIDVEGEAKDAVLHGMRVALPVVEKPRGRIEGPGTATVGQTITLDTSANRDPYGNPLSGVHRSWTVEKAPKGSSATVLAPNWVNETAKFRPDRPGDYVISVGLDTMPGYASFTLHATGSDPLTVYPPGVQADLSPLLPGEPLKLRAESASELGHELVHDWRFGDGTVARGDEVSHSFAHPGTYQVQVTVTDTVTQRMARQLLPITVVASRLDNIPVAPCKSESCPAQAPGVYAGSGLGRWQLNNDQPHPQLVNLDIEGLPAGRQVMVSLSNASDNGAGTAELGVVSGIVPSSAQQAADYRASLTQARAILLKRHDEAHAEHLKGERELMRTLESSGLRAKPDGKRRKALQASAPRLPSVVPELGSQRTWQDTTGIGLQYSSRLVDSCTLPGGRAVLFWMEEQVVERALATSEQVAAEFKPVVCGEKGGFHRLQQLLGAEIYGPHDQSSYLKDDTLQPIHVLLVDPGPSVYWAAYVHGINKFLKKDFPDSNEALLMVVNARFVQVELNFIKSALVHEFMHLINDYQRTLLNNWPAHDSWLEETTAMMAEDLISSSLISNADGSRHTAMSMRIASYQATAATHQYLGGSHTDYSVGGSLAAFLDRRAGAQLLRGLTFDCADGAQLMSSLRCLDEHAFRTTGEGLATHYAAMNASLAGSVNSDEAAGMGMPALVNGDIDLPAIDLKRVGSGPPMRTNEPWTLAPGSHVYLWDNVGEDAGGHYRRKGIKVPPGHVLQVLIR